MRSVVAFFIRYPVWVTVLFVSVMVFGLLSMTGMRYSFFPETTPDMINVQVPFPGASPEEVAEGVVLKIEERLDGLDGVERVTSTSREHIGTLSVETIKGSDIDKVLSDVKNAVDQINSFPVDAEEPIIFEQKFRTRVLSIVVFGETDRYNLKYYAEDLRDQLLAVDGVSQVDIKGIPDLEFSLEVSESDLRRYNLTFGEIAAAVSNANVNISGGKFETKEEEILIRSWGRGYYVNDLLDIPVRSNPDGTVVLLGDLATLKEQWEDVPNRDYYNDQSAAVLVLDQTKSEDILYIADTAYSIIASFNEANEAVQAELVDDRTIPLRQRVDLLLKNGLIGLFLVIIALGFFLNLRLSYWVSVSIPFSFAGMFVVAAMYGITINVISLFGMILVVGILVDDAIVVGENIFAHWERGKPAAQAALDGTMEVIAPVTTSVLTTVIAFTPFFFLDGMMGKFIWHVALVVIASLLFSLVEAFLILPSHLAHSKALTVAKEKSRLRKRLDGIIDYMTHRIYAPLLRRALNNPSITLTTPLALVFVTVGLLGGQVIGFSFFPYVDRDNIPITVSLVSGSQEADTRKVLQQIESAAWEVNDDLRSERPDSLDVILGISREIGTGGQGESGSHTGNLNINLLDGETRNMESQVIAGRIREKVGQIPEAEQVAFAGGGFFGKPVSVSLLGNDVEQLNLARDLLKEELSGFTTLKDITDTDQLGRRELDIHLKPRAHALGLTVGDIAGQVRQAFYGQEIQRIQRGRDEIRVWVRYGTEDRSALGRLDQMRIRTPRGEEYPFTEVAEYTIARGVTQISRQSNKQEVKVEANLADPGAPADPIRAEVQNEVVPRVLARVNGVTAAFEGQSRDLQKTISSIQGSFPLAFLIMVILVVLVFRSYVQAAMIFSLVPLGVLGAIWGHGFHGMNMSILSIIGIIALSGIIINDSIVLVSQTNRYLTQGQSVRDAVYNAGIARLRPILLTTITTALGLAPLILETSRQAQFLIPMAISVAYGMVFGTFVLLLILPTIFLVANRVRVQMAAWFEGKRLSPEAVEPAVQELQTQPTE